MPKLATAPAAPVGVAEPAAADAPLVAAETTELAGPAAEEAAEAEADGATEAEAAPEAAGG